MPTLSTFGSGNASWLQPDDRMASAFGLSTLSPASQGSFGGTPTYGYDNGLGKSGGTTVAPFSGGGTMSAISGMLDAYNRKTYPELYGGGGTTPATGGSSTSLGGDWSGVDQWTAQINAAATKYNVPANLVKAVMKLESDGDPNAAGSAGVWGPMQVNSNAWGVGPWSTDASANIDKGVSILADAYAQYGDWTMALRAYHGFGSDGNTTDQQYADIVNGNWNTLNAAGTGGMGSVANGMNSSPGGSTAFSSVWGGTSAPITQEFGHTDFADNSDYARQAYGYTAAYTRDGSLVGHGGVDVGVGLGTSLYSPVSGTVTIAGGTGYYCDSVEGKNCNAPGSGELMIQMANGDQVILGHMSTFANLQVGQQVNAGQLVGTSGGENGPHVHIEYRQYAPGQTSSGYLLVDPEQALGGTGSVTGGAGASTSPGWMGAWQANHGFGGGSTAPAASGNWAVSNWLGNR